MNLEELKLSDLVKTCEKCGGSGWLVEHPQSAGGSFGSATVRREGTCPECERGSVFTPLGKVLREFVQRIGHT